MSKKNPFVSNRTEIIYRVINSILSGILVFLGAMTTGTITRSAIIAAVSISLIAAITQFKKYWEEEEGEYKRTLFCFIR